MPVMTELLVRLKQQKHALAPLRRGNKGCAFRGSTL